MAESLSEGQRNSSLKKLIGKIAIGVGLCLISFVIVFGMFASVVSADSGSTDLILVYDTISTPVLVFGFLFVIGGLIAILLPEGLSRDGLWSLQTGPLR